MKYLFLIASFLVLPFLAFSLSDSTSVAKRTYTTQRIVGDELPKIDGSPDEPVWETIDWSGDFIQNAPAENTPPSQQTKFKILYDEKHLYIAFWCYDDEPEKVEKRLTRRDAFAGDRIEINIDSYNDKRTGFSFSITAAGVRGDEFISENGNNWDASWNPIWYANAKMQPDGWSAEAKIPLSQLRFGNSAEQAWGIQINRNIFRKEERSVWQRIPQDAPGWVSEFGELRGLVNIKPQRQLEIQPFTVVQYENYQAEEGNPFRDGNDFGFNGGLDAKIGITNDLTLDLTINPDFGQVDADPGAIALDGFQIFFEERRPFFVENKNIFDFQFANNNDNIFYSRRIGRSPQGSIDLADNEFDNTPTNSAILGAAKFSGKTQNGWSVGLLESVTGRVYSEIDKEGERRKEIVEPLTNYVVARTQKDFNDRNSFIGGIFTATNRDLPESLDDLHKSAYTAGLDFMHTWKQRKYYATGNFVASTVTGTEEAILNTQESITHLFQRIDASHLSVDSSATSLSGTGGKFEIGKNGGGTWRYNAGVVFRSPELELNDIGFLRQADEIRQYTSVSKLFLKPTSWYRRANINFSQLNTYDFEGNYNRFQLELSSFVNFANNWWVEVGGSHKPRIIINSFLRGGPRWRYSEENFFYTYASSDSRKRFRLVLGQVFSRSKEANFAYYEYEARVNYQPIDALSLSLEMSYVDNPNQTQYVTTEDSRGETRYILGKIEQKSLSAALRVNYSINPDLSIQYYGSPFVARGRYSAFKSATDGAAEKLEDRFIRYRPDQVRFVNDEYQIFESMNNTVDFSFEDPDFAFVQYRGNLVARWEYIPGSELFLVWSQASTGSGNVDDSLLRILGEEVLKKKLEHIFLIKATFRFYR